MKKVNQPIISTLLPTITRRDALKIFAGSLASFYGARPLNASTHKKPSTLKSNRFMKQATCTPYYPLHCVAYINPDNQNQAGQEHIVARYPLAIVPQNNKKSFRQWRDRVKSLNPDITLLGYQMVIEETTVPGPGHDYLRRTKNSWSTYPLGIIPKVGPPSKRRRIYDPRSTEWQNNFLEACSRTIESYPYNGLFLDQCAIFSISHPSPSVREEMRSALQLTILQLRDLFPDKVLIGNSKLNWAGLNGEMSENRANRTKEEVGCHFEGHSKPRIELMQKRVTSYTPIESIKSQMLASHSLGMSFGVSKNYQHALWYDFFDEVMDKHISAETE